MPPSAPPPASIYRYGRAELDTGAFLLRVDGRVQACPARALRLLQLLCSAPGRLFQRDELIAVLWPQRRLVSDESLSQVIFKLRTALGADGERIVTVRGAGVRLDAQVTTAPSPVVAAAPAGDVAHAEDVAHADTDDADDADASLPPVTPAPASATPAAAAASPARRRVVALLGAGLLLAAAVLLGLRYRAAPAPADLHLAGWGFGAQQIHAARPDTAALLDQALAADALGDRPRAQVVLAALHDADPATPLPALLLAVWRAGSGDRNDAQRWIARAQPRATASGDALVGAWLQLADAFVRGQSADILAALSALLDRRPDAWILRYARAQVRLQRGQPDAALDDLRRIDVATLADRRSEDVLASRAALGDRTGAEAAYARLDPRVNPVGYAGVGALLAWSADDRPRARAGFVATAALAVRENRDDWAMRAQLLAAVLAVDAHDTADARRRAAEAATRARDRHETLVALDAQLMLAQIAALDHDADGVAAALQGAADAAAQSRDAAWIGIVRAVALRLGGDAPAPPGGDETDLAAQGVAPLLAARLALRDGGIERARALYAQAAPPPAFLREEYALLARELGLPPSPPVRGDAPGPPYFRFVTRLAAPQG